MAIERQIRGALHKAGVGRAQLVRVPECQDLHDHENYLEVASRRSPRQPHPGVNREPFQRWDNP
jgi:hypothetical protein